MTKDQLNDPIWRVCNLYSIINKDGRLCKFRPNPAQMHLLRTLKHRNLILKARQLGFSTLIQILMLDQCIFVPNINAGVIAQDEEAASKIFRDKIKVAWDNMPGWVRDHVHTIGDSVRELSFDNGSCIRVSTSMRSATLQYLHVSEFGKICAKYPEKAREVLTGSIPTLGDNGFCFIESTAEGRDGKFFEMCEEAQRRDVAGLPLSPKDYKFYFFAWHDNAGYTQEFEESRTEADNEYFASIEAQIGKQLTEGQKHWYIGTRRTIFAGDHHMMMQEYPSIPSEAFSQSQEGCYFAPQMLSLRKANRITSVPWIKGYPVDTAWDIGRKDGTAVWMFQKIGLDYRFIRFVEGWEQEYDHYVSEISRHGYVWGTHYLPHDAAHKRQAKNASESKSAQDILTDLGLRNTVIVPQTPQKILSINAARALIPQCYFDKDNCSAGINHLDLYHKTWSRAIGGWTDTPDHDVHSEAADAFQQVAIGYKEKAQFDKSMFNRSTVGATSNPFVRR